MSWKHTENTLACGKISYYLALRAVECRGLGYQWAHLDMPWCPSGCNFFMGGGTESFTGLSPVLPKMSRSMASSSVVQAGKFKAWTLYTWSVLTLMYELETL